MSEIHISTPDEVLEPRVEEVADGMYAYLQLYGQWGLNNAGFLVGRNRAVAIDTAFTVSRARAFKDAIISITDNPCTTVLNTHHHGDHTYGNFLFPEATIIGHKLCREEMQAAGLSTKALFQDGVEWGDIEIDPPFATFDSQLTIYVDEVEVNGYYVGPAHTNSDVVFYIPEKKLLYAGDLAFSGGTPFVVMGSVSGSLTAYDLLETFDIETVVPGHGPICGPEVFDDMAGYLRWIQALAVDTAEMDISPLEMALDADLGRYADWHDSERLVGNLHRALAELNGLPPGGDLDLSAALDDMMNLNGGQPLRCRA